MDSDLPPLNFAQANGGRIKLFRAALRPFTQFTLEALNRKHHPDDPTPTWMMGSRWWANVSR